MRWSDAARMRRFGLFAFGDGTRVRPCLLENPARALEDFCVYVRTVAESESPMAFSRLVGLAHETLQPPQGSLLERGVSRPSRSSSASTDPVGADGDEGDDMEGQYAGEDEDEDAADDGGDEDGGDLEDVFDDEDRDCEADEVGEEDGD